MVFDLIAQEAAAAPRDLAAEALPGTHFGIFRASATAAGRLREIQARARAAKAAGGADPKGRLFLTVEPCRRIDPPPGPVRVDLYLSLGEKEDFFKVYDDVDLRDPQVLGGKFETAVPPCGATAKRTN